MVDARDHGGGVQAAHDKRADAKGNGDEPLDAVDDEVFHGGEHRANGRQGEIAGDEHRHQRRHKEVKHGRHDFMKPLFQEAHEPHGDDDRDHVALVAHQGHFIEAEEHRLVEVWTPSVATVQAFWRLGWSIIMPMTAPRKGLPPKTLAAEKAIRMGRNV